MKKCTNCAKDLPDAALHCVFCGSKQPPAPAPVAGAQAKTVMGWQATDLLKDLQAKGAQPAPGVQMPPAARPAGPPPAAPAMAPPPAAPPPMSVQATIPAHGFQQPPPAAPPASPAASAATMFVQGPALQMPQAPPAAAAPPPAASPAASAATMFVQGPAPVGPPQGGYGGPPPPQGGYGGPPPPQGGYGGPPPPQGPPQGGYGGPPPPQGGYGGPPPPQGGYGGPPPPMGPPQGGYGGPPQGGYGGPPQGGYGGPPQGGMGGYNPVPVNQGGMPGAGMAPSPMSPPYLASRTAARVGAPVEPYKDGIKLVLIVFGALLLAVFAVPMVTDPSLGFRWDALSSDKLDALAKFDQIYFAAAGLLALVFGAVPLATVPRGALAAVLGLVPLVLSLVNHIRGPEIQWQFLVGLGAALTLVPGLMLRQEYRSQMLPRLLTTIGVACVLVVYLVPKGGGDPPIVAMFEAIGNAPGKMKVLAILRLLPVILAALALLVWLPPPSSAAAQPVAWLWIVLGVIISYVTLLVAGHIGDAVSKAPNSVLIEPWGGAAFSAFIGYGVATIFGKGLEHS